MIPQTSNSEAIRKYLGAYESKDRDAIEEVLADDFTFTSPIDDHIDRGTYFAKCWPNSEKIERVQIESIVEQGDEAFVLYNIEQTHSEDSLRNVERVVAHDGQIHSVECYFGTDIGWAGGQPAARRRQ